MKKWLILLGALAAIYGLGQYSGYSTLVLRLSEAEKRDTRKFARGETVNPFKSFDFDHGDWRAYLVISPGDFGELAPSITRAACLQLTDRQALKRMRETWNFVYTGGDMATVQSALYLLKDGKLVFESGILLGNAAEGLQSPEYGWLEPAGKKALSDTAGKFTRVYWPLLLL